MLSDRIQYVTHRNSQILYLDFRGIELEDVAEVLDAAKDIVAGNPVGTVRHLTDVRGTYVSKEIVRHFKVYAKHNTPYIHRSAAVGVTGIMVVLFNAVLKFSGRKNIVLKKTVEEALEWLTEDVSAEETASDDDAVNQMAMSDAVQNAYNQDAT